MKSRHLIFISLICSIHLFGLHHNFGPSFYFILDALGFSLIFADLISKKRKYHNKDPFKFLFIGLFVAIGLSAVSCFFYHDQDIISTTIAMRYFIYLLIYFQLQKVHLTIDWIEKGIIIGAILYMSAFTLQYILFPFKILDYGSITEMERGLLRFRIEGAGFLMLATFLALNRFIEKRSIKFLIFYTIGMVFLFMLGFRTLLVAGIISSFYLIIKLSKKPSLIVRNTIISIALSSPLLLVDEVNSYITEMTEISEKQINSGDDYIRKRTFKFYMEKVNIDEISLLFGNGFPQENSKYGKITHSGSKLYGYIFADLGIVGFAIIYGLIATLFFLLILIKAIRIKTDREYYYLSAYFLYIFIACFTTAELYRAGIFGIQALGLFLISRTKIS